MDDTDTVRYRQIVGTLSFGINHPRIFLSLCKAYQELNLDIIDVVSHVRKGWFVKLILGRNKNEDGLSFERFRKHINKVARTLNFSTECFIVPESAQASEIEANVVIVLQCDNRVGFLAALLEVIDKYQIDIVDIDVWMDETEETAALKIHTYIPTETAEFFEILEGIRSDMKKLKEGLGLKNFDYMVHSSETFEFIQRIDYERQEE
ncbi:MAG: hypothetical protein HY867_14920 [Chloroflexi bacterium]|nr:hypothetical protein [Chloroflexota bacterium]